MPTASTPETSATGTSATGASVHEGAATVARPSPGARIGWAWVLLSSIGIAAFAVTPYLTASLRELGEAGTGLAGHYDGQPAFVQVAFSVHIVFGGFALVTGPLQFWRGLRDRMPRLHRWVGRAYLGAVGVGGLAGLAIAPFSQAGLVGFFGFGALAVLWLVSGWRGYRAIRRGDVANHRAWMMRNFAFTYSAVMLRLWVPALLVLQIPFAGEGGFDFDASFANAYAAVPFLCWLPNVVVAEWLIRRRGLPSYVVASAPVARVSQPRRRASAAIGSR
ncbi:DUF2306 domain-containing protein [Agromyces larvae]|uniref:DUF2306 domain-containing protein n=1 Tax=Agromyces larvae TaxID=2929802 RepID=A0ABY4BZN4_9MICO|nr:DUF2306 domain-containing protein [Agromyces larvae]UOE43321.1 DUF2306 domain-containing protein [Agromyces larvae]